MAKLFNRAKMTTATTGSGTVTLGSASNGFQTFAAAGVSNGDVVQYVIEEGANFEIGTGTYSSSGTSLTRSPTESSNSDNAITLAGQATVSITAVADDLNRLQHGGSDKVTVSSTGASVTGNLAVSGTVDGRDVASDGDKLDNIESNATADQTAAQIRAKVEAATDSNVFTDADHSKLNGIETGATGDQTNAEIRAAVEAATDSNVFTDADHTKLNGIEANAKNDQTITAGGGLTGGGTGDVTISHSDTSSQASVNGSGRTYIQDITLDTYGHVTGLATASETVVNTNTIPNNATITLTAGNALTGGGNFTTDQSANETITFNHSDTSSQASVNNSGRTYIQDVTLDAYGHVTGLATATETVVNTDTNTTDWRVQNSGGTQQFAVSAAEGVRFAGSGATSVAFDASTQKITISSTDTNTDTNTNQLTTFQVEDGDGTEVTISQGKEWKFVEGGGIDINWTDTSTGSDGDPFDLTIKHNDTSSQASVNNSGRTYIQDITLDTYGHITGITSATETVVNTDTNTTNFNVQANGGTQVNISAGEEVNFINGNATTAAVTDQANPTVTFHHNDTSSQASVNNSSGTVIQDVTLDGYGHVTGLASVDLDSRFVNVTGDTMTGDLTIPNKIIHSGDTDTYFQFHGANLARMVLAGAEVQEWGANYTLFSDNDTVRLGSGSDFRMWFDGTNTYFRNYAHAGGDIYFQGEDAEGSNTNLINMINSGSRTYVRLFEDGAERLRTLSGGVGVTGLTVGDVDANPHNSNGLQVSMSADEKIVLSGSNNPYIRFQEGTADKAYIQWSSSGFFDFRNMETGQFKFQSTVNGQASDLILLRNDTATVDGEDLGSINFGHTDGSHDYPTQTLSQLPARIVAEATETAGDGDDGARLRFFTKATNANKATDSVERMRIENNGYLEMYARLDMNNNDIQGVDQIFHHGDTNTYMQFHASDQWRVVVGGSERLEVKNSSPHVLVSGDLNSTSDERLKKNIKPIDNALADICQLEGVTFDWKDTGTQGQGFIAQQVEPIIPDVVNTDEDTGMKSINYVGLIGHLVEAIKEQQTQINDLKAEIQSMKS